ncbi:MAG: Beta-galactosidase [Firmicutes bacterium ADurb.Bin248]|nr:MAG: Beta-galactosidase [Firmicutes bacterium ADurb.Bin248]
MMMLTAQHISCIALCSLKKGEYGVRKTENFNGEWIFIKSALTLAGAERAQGEPVTLPHTWNAADGQDGGNDYFRGQCWYVKRFPRPAGERVFVRFNGVNAIADVFVNGARVARHAGGYSAFCADVTERLAQENVICVSVDNGPDSRTYPQHADFTFYGGIYRDVNLICCDESHFDFDDDGSEGVYVTPRVEGKDASVRVETRLSGAKAGQSIRVRILDALGVPVAEKTQSAEETAFDFVIPGARLWDGLDDPYLYTAEARLLEGGAELDGVCARFGVRSFRVDPNEGFFLNGRSYPLRGVSRHQDRLGVGNALSRADHEEDIRLIAAMGANYIRLAHYQHDPYFYDLCDQYGLVVWAEIPFISKYLPDGDENLIFQMTELVKQNYNHPSIVCWGLSNEISMGGVDGALIDTHRRLNDLCHRLDPTRFTVMANVSVLPADSPLIGIPDAFGYNHYFGWYGGRVEDNAPWLDAFHARHPDKALGLSEYGCEAVLKWHASEPRCGDYSEEYQAYYHEKMLETFAERPYLWSTAVWNMFDFGSDMRDEGGEAGQNHKGLVTFDRKIKKDSYFIYKAWWSREPFVHVCGRRYVERAEVVTRVKVYSNCARVALYANGRLAGEKTGSRVFAFDVPLDMGENTIEARCGELSDRVALRRVAEPNPDYVLPFGGEEVANWFDDQGNRIEFEFPEGYFSVRDPIEEILTNPESAAIVLGAMEGLMKNFGEGGMELPPEFMQMIGSFSIERIFSLAGLSGKKLPREALLEMNRTLTKIKK